ILPGFTGLLGVAVTGQYLVGYGFRALYRVLLRFNSPESLCPFGEGGVIAYGFCGGVPVIGVVASGHVSGFLNSALRALGF
ncbi:RHS repeat-associated core domain-containing protein, partial [Pseudomonas syringae pv. tagetis]